MSAPWELSGPQGSGHAALWIRIRERVYSLQQRTAARQLFEHSARVLRLGAHPALHLWILQVLQIAVVVRKRRAEIGIGDWAHRGHGWRISRIGQGGGEGDNHRQAGCKARWAYGSVLHGMRAPLLFGGREL